MRRTKRPGLGTTPVREALNHRAGSRRRFRQIWRYLLSEARLAIANRIQGDLVNAFERLADVPGTGHKRSDLTNLDVRFFSIYQYMIVYRRTDLLEIVAVLHGKRDVRRLLKTRMGL